MPTAIDHAEFDASSVIFGWDEIQPLNLNHEDNYPFANNKEGVPYSNESLKVTGKA